MNNLFIIKKLKIYNILLALLYFFLMNYVYLRFISEIYEYTGFHKDFNIINVFVSIITIFILYFIIPSNKDLSIYHYLILALLFIPSMVLFSSAGLGWKYYFANVMCVLIVIFVSCFINVRSLRLCAIEVNLFFYFSFAIVFLYFFGIFIQGGFSYFNLDFRKVYEIRSLSADNLIGIYRYFSPAVGKVIVPLLIVVSAFKKKWLFFLLSIVSSVLIFALTSHKSPLFYPVLIFCFYYFSSRKKFSLYILMGCIFITLISIIDFTLINYTNGWFGSIFVRRALLVPSYLNYCYIDYFTNHLPYFWSESKVTCGLIPQPYQLKSVNLIGDIYFNNPHMSANAGWIGSGFAHASWYGAIIYSILVGLLISLFDSFGNAIGRRFVLSSSSVILLVIITSSDLITSLMTHGLLFLILIYFCVPRKSFV